MDKETSITKKCEICGEIKFIGEFSKSYKNRCKKCVAEQTRSVRALNKAAKTGAFGFTCEVTSISNQLALEIIETSVNILTNELEYMFNNFPQKDRIIERIILPYRERITEWLNSKTKQL